VYCRQVKLLSNDRISESYYRIGFECRQIAEKARPGQFLMVRVLQSQWEHMLSRPFSFCDVSGDRIELLFNVVGKGTRSLAETKVGGGLEVIGPLGNGFSFEGVSDAILVGGGMGIAPLPFLASELRKSKDSMKMTVLLGARTAASLCLQETFVKLGAEVRVATDDGSAGHKGLVTELLEESLKMSSDTGRVLYACGPEPMLRTVARLTREWGLRCELSVEERMACGVGACMSCACKTRDENGIVHYQRVCTEGPVFNAAELVFDED
jgi:dihydroorotate dehydrogenase electron transfer subunit